MYRKATYNGRVIRDPIKMWNIYNKLLEGPIKKQKTKPAIESMKSEMMIMKEIQRIKIHEIYDMNDPYMPRSIPVDDRYVENSSFPDEIKRVVRESTRNEP